MAEAPVNEATVVDTLDEAGRPTAFPLLKCRNVFVLPGIPSLLQQKWRSVKAQLSELETPPQFRNVVLRMKSGDEALFAEPLKKVQQQF